MGNLWLKIWVWTKVTVFGLIALYLLAFIFKNSDRTAEIWYWFFKPSYKVTILFFTFFVFMSGVISTILVHTTVRTIRQIRLVQNRSRSEKLEREVADMRSKAAMLQTRPASAPGFPVEPIETPSAESPASPPSSPTA
jgi:hypothetical protein